MFFISINELIDVLERDNIKVKLFADDAKLYMRALNDIDIIKLQCASNALVECVSYVAMTLTRSSLFDQQPVNCHRRKCYPSYEHDCDDAFDVDCIKTLHCDSALVSGTSNHRGITYTKSCTLDPIPTFLLKESIDVLRPFITAMINASLQTG